MCWPCPNVWEASMLWQGQMRLRSGDENPGDKKTTKQDFEIDHDLFWLLW